MSRLFRFNFMALDNRTHFPNTRIFVSWCRGILSQRRPPEKYTFPNRKQPIFIPKLFSHDLCLVFLRWFAEVGVAEQMNSVASIHLKHARTSLHFLYLHLQTKSFPSHKFI